MNKFIGWISIIITHITSEGDPIGFDKYFCQLVSENTPIIMIDLILNMEPQNIWDRRNVLTIVKLTHFSGKIVFIYHFE